MENELGYLPTRTEVWLETHTKNNGTYLNNEVMDISDKIMKEMGQSSSSESQSLTQDDPLGRVLGKEHPGRVRGLGFGPTPSFVFGSTSRTNGAHLFGNQMKECMTNLEKELEATKSQIKDMKKTFGGVLVDVLHNAFGKVPEEFAIWLNQTCAMASDEESRHQQPEGNENGRNASHDVSSST